MHSISIVIKKLVISLAYYPRMSCAGVTKAPKANKINIAKYIQNNRLTFHKTYQ